MIVLKMTEDAQCPSCKVIISRHGFRANCPYCGTYFDPRRRSFQEAQIRTTSSMRRSASAAQLPALNGHSNGQQANNNSVFSELLIASLGRVTLGPIGIDFDSDRLPYLTTTDRNKLVSHGSGNTSPNNPQSSENKRSAKPKYNTDSRLSKSEFGKILSLAKKSKDWTEVEEFYAMTFANCANICATFKKG